MGKTVIRPVFGETTNMEAVSASTPRPRTIALGLRSILAFLASLRLTVFLFVLSLILIFCGTLAQIDQGIWTVLRTYFRSPLVWIPSQIFVEFTQIFFKVPAASFKATGAFPFPGGLAIGSALMVNLLAAHAVRFKLSWKRSGVLILHSGLIVMLLSEFLTGQLAIEGNMTIPVSGSSNFLEHREYTELAIVNSADSTSNNVVVIPGAKLRRGGLIQSDLLPFDVRVDRYMVNSASPKAPPAGMSNPATAGDGLSLVTVESPEVSGTDPNQRIDLASAYVTFEKKGTGAPLGTYLVSLWFYLDEHSQQIELDGKTYDIDLRFKRTYKPYTLQLTEFHHDLYIGTDTPKNFSSRVRLQDPTRHEDRDVVISMNHPLRYEGETFYQAGWIPGDKGTILQVVHNPGWIMPYVSCFLVVAGMMIHFLLHLFGFLGRFLSLAPSSESGILSSLIPGVVVALASACLLVLALPPKDTEGQMRFQEFAQLPVVDGGRVKPMDTFARTSLKIIRGSETFRDDAGQEQPAVKWLLDVMTSRFTDNPAALKHKVIRIHNDQLLDLLGLKPRPEQYLYALEEFSDKIGKLSQEAERASKIDSKQHSPFDAAVLELHKHLQLYVNIATMMTPLTIPPASQSDDWQPLLKAVHQAQQKGQDNPAARAFAKVLMAYGNGKTEEFNQELANFRKQFETSRPADLALATDEVLFNHFQPFYLCIILYAVIFLMACLSWLFAGLEVQAVSGILKRTAFWLAILTFLVHTLALVTRMYLQGRPPVTNLYSTAIFVGWVCLFTSLVIEAIFKNGFGIVVASLIGFLTLILAQHVLAADGKDTMEMMQAVLDTNFWLSTHVVSVNMGYAATILAGTFGALFILLGFFSPVLRGENYKALTQMIYGSVCFATLLSFVGTVLGGIWADQSWGRFWGWDPKENGALLVVLWNALILHARWGGIVKQRGMAVLTLVGNIITGWSWFGTNQLGVGLHAYGFSNTLAEVLRWFWLFNIVLIVVGVLPLSWWRSFAPAKKPSAQTAH